MTETSKEYAVALFTLAAEENVTKEVSDGLKTISRTLREAPEYLDFLASPNISVRERTDAIEEALGGRIHEYAVSFLKVLCEKNNARYVHKIIADYEDLYHANDGISRVGENTGTNVAFERLVHNIDKRVFVQLVDSPSLAATGWRYNLQRVRRCGENPCEVIALKLHCAAVAVSVHTAAFNVSGHHCHASVSVDGHVLALGLLFVLRRTVVEWSGVIPMDGYSRFDILPTADKFMFSFQHWPESRQ